MTRPEEYRKLEQDLKAVREEEENILEKMDLVYSLMSNLEIHSVEGTERAVGARINSRNPDYLQIAKEQEENERVREAKKRKKSRDRVMEITLYELYILLQCLSWTLQYNTPGIPIEVKEAVRKAVYARLKGHTVEVPTNVKKIVDKLIEEAGSIDSSGDFTTEKKP